MSELIKLHEAYTRGDLEAVKAHLGDPPDFPNCRGRQGMGEIILEYAIYHSPLSFIQTLLELGSNPNYDDHAGLPSLIAALSSSRRDTHEIVELLLSFGADIHQRGVNDFTPLHWAAAHNDVKMLELLFSHGADPLARTRIDDFTTPLEEAKAAGHVEAIQSLRRAIST